ncbi:ligand-gated channel protein [Bibersteinia trehalosi Y31]|uniref:Ligand-gated channel protein n=1 Tax=Bibersteinia trehalosi Y31 TaxID=1261658 RepID=A0A179CVA5_BIBTR|nr:TonB-dependent hemoglobin/transferrin/lactoferrin family receptor [Bibersteinia trehalosi]OAQ13833.1 ligand-gated channel protein [Bibersteinia trehalosi Y31]
MKKNTALMLLAILGVLSLPNVFAEELVELDEVRVVAKEEAKTNGEIKKSRRVIQDELIADTKDLVRYTTDVGIADSGRHNKGFAMRGVEGNRVGINIDGVSLPDSEENSLYARYGNFNSSRVQIDPELVTGIDIMRGADSFAQGSGALGGGVSYRTVVADDIVQMGNRFGGLFRSGYATKNNEWTNTVGAAYKDEKWEAVGLYSYRRGHELKSLGNGADISGAARGVPDPSHHRNHNYLAKLSYFINDNHRISLNYTGQNHENLTDERSYTFVGWRRTLDTTERDNLNVAYEYFPSNGLLGYLKLDYDWQKITVGAINLKGLYRTDGVEDLDDIFDRRMKNDFHRINLRLDSSPLESRWGTHNLSLRTAYSQREFKNINKDIYLFGELDQALYISAVQKPVRTQNIYLLLQDKIMWNEQLSSDVGVRYDFTKLTPRASNVYCQFCDQVSSASTTFQNLSGSFGLDYQINPTWKAGYHISSGYRIPTATEMYFTFLNAAGNWLANPNLKAERSLNQSVALAAENEQGNFALQLYRTNYKDFLYERETAGWRLHTNCDFRCSSPYYRTLFQQAVNIDRAKISGLEVRGMLNLHHWVAAIPQGISVMGALGYSKGKLYGTSESLLSIQPVKVILGAGYDDPNDRWGLQARWTYLGQKKGKDAQILTYYYDQSGGTSTYPFLNRSAVLFDMYGFAKIGKHTTLRAGVYNLFNRKYHTWDSLRGINLQSTTNTVDREGKGLERFYAPGRNYAFSVEIKF